MVYASVTSNITKISPAFNAHPAITAAKPAQNHHNVPLVQYKTTVNTAQLHYTAFAYSVIMILF